MNISFTKTLEERIRFKISFNIIIGFKFPLYLTAPIHVFFFFFFDTWLFLSDIFDEK